MPKHDDPIDVDANGATPHDRDPFSAAPNHSNRVYFDEGTMVQGMAVYSAMAIRHLSGLPG